VESVIEMAWNTQRRAASYVDRLFKGAKPSDLAIEQVDAFKLVINVRVARELGLEIPESLMTRASEILR
jgi:putative ABC transport system substrate-binding protein